MESLRSLLRVLGSPTPSDAWLDLLAGTRREEGLSLADLRRAADAMGVALVGWQMSLADLLECHQPAIMHLTGGHFSTLLDVSDGMVRWLDGGTRLRVTPAAELAEAYSGYCLLPSPDQSPSGPPQLVFDRPDFDAGDVGAQTVEHVFRCTNRGADAVRFGAMAASRDCVADLPDGAEVEPGGSCRMTVTAPAQHRQFVHWIEVGTTDRARPVVYLTLRGGVPTPVTASPPGLALTCKPGEQASGAVWLIGPRELRVRRIQSDANFVVAETDDRHTERERFAEAIAIPILVRVIESPSVPWMEAELTIETNDARTPVLSVPLGIRSAGRVHSIPSELYFGFVRPGATLERTLVVSGGPGPRLTVTRATCDAPGVSLGVPATQGDGTYAITVTLDTRGRAGRIEGSIRLSAHGAGQATVAVPVYAHVLR